MKLMTLCLAISFLTVGCGSEEQTNLSSQDQIPQLPFAYHTVNAVVTDAATLYGFPGPDGQSRHQTTATVEIDLKECGQKVRSFVYETREHQGKVHVHYQAVVQSDLSAGECLEAPDTYKTFIMSDGVYSTDDFIMVNVAGLVDKDSLRQGETNLYPVTAVKVLKAAPICPPPADPNGISCKALGSNITLELAKFGCLDRKSLANWKVSKDPESGKIIVHLAAFGINHIGNQRARCSEEGTKRKLSLTTLFDVRSPQDVEVKLLRGI